MPRHSSVSGGPPPRPVAHLLQMVLHSLLTSGFQRWRSRSRTDACSLASPMSSDFTSAFPKADLKLGPALGS